jgi:septal ring factor EnvC (AmiA/AmiB activator)
MNSMRKPLLIALVLGLTCSVCVAVDPPKPEVLQQMYKDTVAQLKDAQDRKNELAGQNDKLLAQIKQLQADLADRQAKIDALTQDQAELARRTLTLRAWNAAWQVFIQNDMELRSRWNVFLEQALGDDPSQAPAVPVSVSGGASRDF